MLEEKEEALRQISAIKNHLVDKQTFFPYNYYVTYVWAIIAIILVSIMIPMYEASILQGTLVSIFLITTGFVLEGIMTKKVNQTYDIEECTRRQKFIVTSFIFLSLFLIAISAIFAAYQLYVPMFLTWLFMVSMGYFSVGFVLNIQRFSQMARFNMLASVVLLVIGYIDRTLEGTTGTYLSVVQIFVILGLSVMPAIVAWQQIKDEK
ncbi:MAG: hypothetical protein DSZ09_04915 [Sulfurovum sp.]|nr:MAG: hypothetical protein DSZ09_04915 [Sulfurovum sp.]RUM70681.1 MAG: hypothetical protein DSZ08_04355 [Sulfurovum sp.]